MATTYNLELEFFDEYLFRRLGEPPLNASILMDAGCHARLWEDGDGDARRLRRANRDYLLRPIQFGSGAFHSKAYFFGNAEEGTLLLGSGNATLYGLERGREVFARFDSRGPDQVGSIRSWREWMAKLVERVDDDELTYRFLRLRQECGSWLEGDPERSLVADNSERSLLEQLCDGLSPPVDELHLLAPFYDRGALAVRKMLDVLQPREIRLYIAAGTSVDGRALAAVVEESGAAAKVCMLEPDEFVHAKLIGVVLGDRGRMLLGSANLSQAALLAATEPWANTEIGVLCELPPSGLRQAFCPPESEWRPGSLDQVATLEFTSDESVIGLPVLLRAAWPEQDGRVTISVKGEISPAAELTAGSSAQPLEGLTTAAPLILPGGGVLVWLRSVSGEPLSNKVPLDDRRRMRSWLEVRTESSNRPRELDAGDFETPVGRMLIRLHEECIFDIDETPAAARGGALTDTEAEAGASQSWEELEERLAREELARDPRVERYRRLGNLGLPLDDDILVLLRMMLDRAPGQRALHLVGELEEPGEPGTGKRWTPEQRLRVRLFNVLQRWALALSDPRFAWIGTAAPIRNYGALLVACAECWEQAYLPEERVIMLIGSLFGSLLQTDRARGYLLLLPEEQREEACARMPPESRAISAALAYAALRPSARWSTYLFDWQPAIAAGLDLGLFEPTKKSSLLVKRLTGERPTRAEVSERLHWAANYIDDEHWAIKQERELGFGAVRLTRAAFSGRFGITLAVSGDGASLTEPRLVSLVRQALAYRHTDGVIVEVGPVDRLSVKLGDHVWAMAGGVELRTRERFDLEGLAQVERQGISFGRLLEPAHEAAS